ncbi:L-aspartate oxidase [Lichenibacterium dinghuense]|uniref:L-aspartate oxidase n=1 Tax=Lichenibacterium dinghuense TaxID=2895977 RepID=UPI001EFF8456|nr:L-aspartate oxidase [Lichenibacterium sp. 6Y81]
MSAPFDVQGRAVIVGGGLAGLTVALRLAPEPCIVLSKAPFGVEASSAWAQGGIAAAVGEGDDPEQHLADTLHAGDGLCDPAVARRILSAGPAAIDDLARLGARFDRRPDGALRLGREAAHGRHRIVHAMGDGTGREVLRAALAAARATPSVALLSGVEARRILVADGRVAGLVAAGPDGAMLLPTRRLVIATGGVAGLYRHGTSPLGAWGSGLALAARAGARLRDMEFVQFHPTALDCGRDPLPLVSEAVRGDGAVLVDEAGARFMAGVPGRELAPRDVVARALWRHAAAGHRVFLDARAAIGGGFAARFPSVTALCAAAGIDPAREPIPVRPAAHYGMGGIAVDAAGRSSVEGLWACGEAASTGLHGANRLASNSLLEAAVCAGWVAEDLAGTPAGRPLRFEPAPVPARPDPAPVRGLVSAGAGVLRDRAGLAAAVAALLPLAEGAGPAADPAAVGLMIATAALERRESRGAHHRTDAPEADPAAARSRSATLAETFASARAHTFEDA